MRRSIRHLHPAARLFSGFVTVTSLALLWASFAPSEARALAAGRATKDKGKKVADPTERPTTPPSSAAAAAATPSRSTRLRLASGAASLSAVIAADIEQRAFQLINEERFAKQLSRLSWDADLYDMARAHSEDMARHNFFSHTSSDGAGMVKRAGRRGVSGWRALGENLAFNVGYSDPAASAVAGWVDSAKHRRNMLRPRFTHTAVAVARGADGRFFFTQIFASK